ncbi:hypothetical protein ACJJTC_009560 [Scirpophaga incertulas]
MCCGTEPVQRLQVPLWSDSGRLVSDAVVRPSEEVYAAQEHRVHVALAAACVRAGDSDVYGVPIVVRRRHQEPAAAQPDQYQLGSELVPLGRAGDVGGHGDHPAQAREAAHHQGGAPAQQGCRAGVPRERGGHHPVLPCVDGEEPRRRHKLLDRIHFDFTVDSILCLADSVLAFHRHGVQGRSLRNADVTQEIADLSRSYRLLGHDKVVVLESHTLQTNTLSSDDGNDLYILAGHEASY